MLEIRQMGASHRDSLLTAPWRLFYTPNKYFQKNEGHGRDSDEEKGQTKSTRMGPEVLAE